MINTLGHLKPDHNSTAALDFVEHCEQSTWQDWGSSCLFQVLSRVQMSSICAEWLNFIVSCDTIGAYEHLGRKCKLAQHIELERKRQCSLSLFH